MGKCLQEQEWGVVLTAMKYAKMRTDFNGNSLLYHLVDEYTKFYTAEMMQDQFVSKPTDKLGLLNMGCNGTKRWSDTSASSFNSVDWECIKATLSSCVDNPTFANPGSFSRCDDLIIFFMGYFNSQTLMVQHTSGQTTATNTLYRAWSRLLSKSAFEHELDSVRLIALTKATCGRDHTTGIFTCTSVEVYTSVVFEEHLTADWVFNLIWPLATLAFAGLVAAEFIYYWAKMGLDCVLQILHSSCKQQL